MQPLSKPRAAATEVTYSVVRQPTPEPPPTPPDMPSDNNSTSLDLGDNDHQIENVPLEDHTATQSPVDNRKEDTVPLLESCL